MSSKLCEFIHLQIATFASSPFNVKISTFEIKTLIYSTFADDGVDGDDSDDDVNDDDGDDGVDGDDGRWPREDTCSSNRL